MKERSRFTIIALIACLGTLSTPVLADKEYQVQILTAAQSPVSLDKCEVWTRDWNKTVGFAHASLPNRLLDVGISFTNKSDKTINVVRLKYTAYDSFGEALGEGTIDTQSNSSASKMSVAPGQSFDLLGPKSWHGYNVHQDQDHATCEITGVRYSDGSTWVAQAEAVTPQASPTSSPQTMQPAPAPSPAKRI